MNDTGISRILLKSACLGLIPALFTGCSSLSLKLGAKVDLSKIPVSAISVRMARDPGIAPGKKASLIATLTGAKGETLTTEGAGHGKVRWKDLAVTATIVRVNAKGVLSLPRDPRKSDNQTGHVVVTVPSQPTLRAELDVPFRYNIRFTANFSGSKGMDGLNGQDGSDGSMGLPGSIDPNNPSAGGNGGDGSDGTNGQDGSRGGDAPPVQIRLTMHPGPQPLIEAGVQSRGARERFYLIDPNGGALYVYADGGAGGSGGKGGRGGRGGQGGTGTPDGSNGHDGLDGHAGMDGSSGFGGEITVLYDPSVAPYLAALHLSNDGGPRPTFHQQSIPPLW